LGATLLALGVCEGPHVGAAGEPEPLKGLEAYVEAARETWGVPGLAVAVVKDGEVVYARGFGVRELGRPEAVDEHTLFAIGSTTKAITAAAIALLVDEGRLGWDDRLIERLPGFQLYDAYATREMRIRDLLCHRSGLGRADMIWFGSGYDRAEVLRRVSRVEPSFGFRSRFGYQNIMFLAAGEVLAATAGQSWDDFVAERIFKPLGMSRSNTTVRGLAENPNVATPHAEVEGEVLAIPYRNIDNVAPAGAINSCAADMAQWIKLVLGGGVFEGNRMISEKALREMLAPQAVLPQEFPSQRVFPDSHLAAYGLGWMLRDYHGRLLVHHGGGIDGMIAEVALVPEENVGVVALTNLSPNALDDAVAMRIIDAYLGAPERDWSGELLEVQREALKRAEAERKRQEEARVADAHPSLPLKAYVGGYESDIYGRAEVSLEEGRLVLRRGEAFVGDLEPWHYDVFMAHWREKRLGRLLVRFSLSLQGKVEALRLPDLGEFKRVEGEAQP